jgi:DNA polymerase elongation subunit (family B)
VGDLGSNKKNKIKIMIGDLYFTFNRQNFLFAYLAKKLVKLGLQMLLYICNCAAEAAF